MKKTITIIMMVFTIFLFTACEKEIDLTETLIEVVDVTDTSEEYSEEEIIVELDSIIEQIREGEFVINETYSDFVYDTFYLFENDSDSFTITKGGVYVLEGTYTSTITIDVDDEDVDLILLNATISVSSGPAILVLSGDEITISSPITSVNVIEDSDNHPLDEEGKDYNAAIYSKSDLVFNGSGTLTVNGNYNNAINSRDDIKIVDLTLNINSIDDGIIGKDYIAIDAATITVDTIGDCLSSTNDEDTNKGFIYIESGTFDLTTDSDALDAANSIIIYDGTFTIDAGDKGIQATGSIQIGNGTFTINAHDDAINSDSEVLIYDGDITITTGDDAIHGFDLVQIEGGTINILESYEGIEALVIEINGGTINIVSSDDALNATTGGGQEHGPQYISLGGTITINGGIIQISSTGDGVDVNGDATMTDGYLVVYGPTTDRESTIDFDGTFIVSGGLVIAIGSDGMLQSLSESSEQNSLVYADGESFNSGTTIALLDADGNTIISIDAIKTFEAVVISSEDMILGNTYTLEVGNDSFEFTINSSVTSIGSGGNVEGGGLPPRP